MPPKAHRYDGFSAYLGNINGYLRAITLMAGQNGILGARIVWQGGMGEVRNFNEMAEYLKASSYFKEQIEWASARQDWARVEHYAEALHALRKSHHDYITGELEIEPAYAENQAQEINDPLSMWLFAIGVLSGVPLPVFDASDHYSI